MSLVAPWSVVFAAGVLAGSVVVAQAGSKPASDDEGASLYSDNCSVCHGPKGKGSDMAPSLEAATDPREVADMVRQGKGRMPSFADELSAPERRAVAGFVVGQLASFSVASGDLSRGGVLYRVNCSPCHRTAIRGGALLYADTIAPPLTGLDAVTIVGAIRSGPGTMPAFPVSVLSAHDLASVVEYVQLMQSPPHPGGQPLGYYGPVAEGLVAFAAVGLLALLAVWIEARGRG